MIREQRHPESRETAPSPAPLSTLGGWDEHPWGLDSERGT